MVSPGCSSTRPALVMLLLAALPVLGRAAYAIARPRQDATWSGSIAGTGKLSASRVARYRDPVDRGSWLTLDLAADLAILPTMTVRLEADNLLDREVGELHGVPLPGCWLSLTATLRGAP